MIESPIVIAAIVALLGVITSVSASLLITFLSTRSEMRKIKSTLKNQYASSLLEKRISVYTDCYYILSHFIKHARCYIKAHSPLTYADVNDFNIALSEWDSRNALFLSPRSTLFIHSLRKEVQKILNNASSDADSACKIVENLEELLQSINKLEKALKNDIGVYDVERHEDRDFIMSNKDFVKSFAPELV